MAREYRQNASYGEILVGGDESSEGEETNVSHGNTGLPFGLCKKYEIALPKNATPRDAWNALKGKGITPEQVYADLAKTNGVKPRHKSNLSSQRVENEISNELEAQGVVYNEVLPHINDVSEEQIITALAGGDKTKGSCASVGLAYVGQKIGFHVLDFRGGNSQEYFANYRHMRTISELPNLKTTYQAGHYYNTIGSQLLRQVENGKQYYMVCGKHAAVVRRTNDGKLQYLELQSQSRSGWTDFNGNVRYTLSRRFGCPSSRYPIAEGFMIDLESFKDCKEFKDILGFINTVNNEQRKGESGTIK